ncbi:MAG: segregation/condensation protein A [Chloroflexia bacterium]|nr:segregation/condensation protein A [Chloroflexia bacterium]
MVDAADPLALSGYQLRLPSFEGPLDVLLRLIEREQLAIADVSLVAVTDQFLTHLAAMGAAPPAEIAAFSAVAARLLVLKSRSLLPRPPAPDADEGDDDLVHQLREHRALKAALAELSERDRLGEHFFPRGGAVALELVPAPARLAPGPPAALARALRRRLSLLAPPPHDHPVRRVVSLPGTVARLLGMLAARSRLRFSEVVGDRPGREEVLVAFLAVLVLLRRQQVAADQTEPFGEIELLLLGPVSAAVAAEANETGFA